MTISLSTGTKKHRLSERGADLYETHPAAVHALLKAEPVPFTIWEPACGPGSIVTTLRDTGRAVIATDLHNWECPDSQHGVDFLMERAAPPGIGAIVTNPPYALAGPFVRKARELCPLVMMLVRLAFLESTGRNDILDSGDLARVLIFRNRLPMMHRHGWEGPRASSAMAFAWMVWDRDHSGPTVMRRIRWE
jgi:hypothetical protein